MIQGIFYARFFPRKGPKIVAQSPPGCIVPQAAASGSTPTASYPAVSTTIGTVFPSSTSINNAAAAVAGSSNHHHHHHSSNNNNNSSSNNNSSTSSPPPSRYPLFDFDVVRSYIIPRQPFCNRLVTVNDPSDKFSIIGFPVLIPDERYRRNEFMFNFGLVIESGAADLAPFERVVRRLAATFAEMEKQSGFLSAQDKEGDGDGDGADDDDDAAAPPTRADIWRRGSGLDESDRERADREDRRRDRRGPGGAGSRRAIENLVEIIREDLNNYGECMIPVDEANTINMKLFPRHRPPPEVKGWHVPVAKLKLADIVDPTWDITLQKIISHIDGVSDIRRIAWQADVGLDLAKAALRHLLYYDAILLLDMFFFGSCYAPRPGVHDFVANVDGIVDECAAYCLIPQARTQTQGKPGGGGGGGGSGGDGGSSGGESGPGSGSASEAKGKMYANANANSSASTSSPHHFLSHLEPHAVEDPRPHHHNHHHHNHHHNRHHSNNINSTSTTAATLAKTSPSRPLSNFQLIKLMTTFSHGKSVLEWLRAHQEAGLDVLRYVDVRRLVQFGVVKGCLYRVHKYVVSKQYLAGLVTGQAAPVPGGDPLQRYMDGCHSFDQIITEQNLTDAEIISKFKALRLPEGDWKVLYR